MKKCAMFLIYSCLVCVFFIGCASTREHPSCSAGDIDVLSSAEFIQHQNSSSNDVVASSICTDFPTTEGLILVHWTKLFLDEKGELPKDAAALIGFAAENKIHMEEYIGLTLTIQSPRRLRYDWYSEKDKKYKTRISVFFRKADNP